MYRPEEYDFQKDVYTSLIRIANYRASGFLTGERKSCNNDVVFFHSLLNDTDQLLERAFRKGKLIAANTEYFLDNYKKVVSDDTAFQAFIHQEDLNELSGMLFESMSTADTRFKNVFDRYWRDRCLRSVKGLYYRYLITDSDSPKYDGLGPEASQMMFDKIVEFVNEIKRKLNVLSTPEQDTPVILATEEESPTVPEEIHVNEPVGEEPKIEMSGIEEPFPQQMQATEIPEDDDIRFLAYVYEKIAAKEFPASAILLGVLRARSASEREFFDRVLQMDTAGARKEMGIGEVSAREVVRLSELMHRIVNHPCSYKVFENPEKAQLALPLIEQQLSSQHIRVVHSYQHFMESCHGSVVDFYLKVAGQDRESVKLEGLNPNKSKELLDIFNGLLAEIDAFVNGDEQSMEMKYIPVLLALKVPDEYQAKILDITRKSGHFPFFTLLSYGINATSEYRDKRIYSQSINLYHGHTLTDLNNVASALGLSRERVRQLREDCLQYVLKLPRTYNKLNLLEDYRYEVKSEYDFNHIREEEQVEFSDEYLTICISLITPGLKLIGDAKKSMLRTSGDAAPLYLVSKRTAQVFEYDKFISAIDDLGKEKRFFPYRDDLEPFVRNMVKKPISEEDFYDILRECRQLLQKGYPDSIINSQLYFPANARKTIPNLIEDILREFNRPMTAEEVCEELNRRYPDLEQIPSKIGPNALRNNNIVAVSRSSTYALVEWNYTEKRGGTIRDLVEEYLNSLMEPIATLSDICEYVAKYRDNVKESSVKSNLLAESTNKFSLFYKGDVMYIGYSDYTFDESYVLQEKRQGRRSFKDSVALLEKFIQDNQRFPYSSGVSAEEIRLSRFFGVCKANIRKGLLEPDEQATIERIETEYKQYKGKKERITKEDSVPWMDNLERYVTYITINESLPPVNSDEALWYDVNKALYDDGKFSPDKRIAFTAIIKIVERLRNNKQ